MSHAHVHSLTRIQTTTQYVCRGRRRQYLRLAAIEPYLFRAPCRTCRAHTFRYFDTLAYVHSFPHSHLSVTTPPEKAATRKIFPQLNCFIVRCLGLCVSRGDTKPALLSQFIGGARTQYGAQLSSRNVMRGPQRPPAALSSVPSKHGDGHKRVALPFAMTSLYARDLPEVSAKGKPTRRHDLRCLGERCLGTGIDSPFATVPIITLERIHMMC